jgi:hypothetical protein
MSRAATSVDRTDENKKTAKIMNVNISPIH